MSKRIYVGNLAYSTTDESLKELFSGIGEVLSSRVIKDEATGRSKGFGFVEMSDEDADKAIADLDGTVVNDRTIRVSEAKPRRETGGRAPGRGSKGGRKPESWR